MRRRLAAILPTLLSTLLLAEGLWAAEPMVANEVAPVEITETVHLGRPHYRITTPTAIYLYDTAAGGFSSIIDPNGEDWVAWSDSPDGEYPASAASAFRGLPNLVHGGDDGGAGHPGFDRCESHVVSERRIQSVSRSGRWQWSWYFFDDHAELVIEKAAPDRAYWFLYEGPAGGKWAPDETYWGSRLGGPLREQHDFFHGDKRFDRFDWFYFGSDSSPYTLWMAQAENDELADLYALLGNDNSGVEAANGMVVAGFGRGPDTTPLLRGPRRFLIGLHGKAVDGPEIHRELARKVESYREAARPGAFPDHAWHYATPESQGVDAEKLETALDVLRGFSGKDGTHETLVIRNGRVIWTGDRTTMQHNIYSATKSLVSTVLGLLIEEGRVNLDTRAAEFEPLLSGQYPEVTLRHFASMTSGYNAVGRSRWDRRSEDWSLTPFEPDTPWFEPGTAFAYWDEAMMMFGRVLQAIAGEDLYEFLDRKLMSRIGIESWDWWYDSEMDGVATRNGATGIGLDAEQLGPGRIAVSPSRSVERRTRSPGVVGRSGHHGAGPERPATIGPTDRSNVLGNGRYGFNWWVRGAMGDMPDTPPGTFYMSGFNNNMCFVVPEWNMVIVRRGEDPNPAQGKRAAYNEFFSELDKAVFLRKTQK